MADFAKLKQTFNLPAGLIHLNGNSLGPQPATVADRVKHVMVDEWDQLQGSAWKKTNWIHLATNVGDRIANLIGAPNGTVVAGDTLTLKLFQALSAALNLNPKRRVVLSDQDNFPTDLYAAQGLLSNLGNDYQLETPPYQEVEQRIQSLGNKLAVLMLTHVNYKTSHCYDMQRLTELAHAQGAVVIWDLAHSAGVLPLNLEACKAEFAVGCTYKYLNGGPGAPAFIYVRKDIIDKVNPIIYGWMGHHAPFTFSPDYKPATGIERMRIGTPPVLHLSVLEAALELWDHVSIHDLRAQAIRLSEQFRTLAEQKLTTLSLISPIEPTQRGGHLAFKIKGETAPYEALEAHGVIADLRPPNLIRFGFNPLFVDEADIDEAIERLAKL